jgi:ABC-type transport system involved in multi-copper enzyme maturation permease subunit
MSAIAAPSPSVPAPAADLRPSLGRLAGVELRKMVDTRAGLWLLVTTGLLTIAIVVLVSVVGDPADQTFARQLEAALAPSSILLPIIGILLVTSEWNQRTALITFSLVPQRGRVLAAKLIAGTALTLAAFLLCVAVAAVGVAAVTPDVDGAWSLSAGLVLQMLISVVTGMVSGIAFGAAILASAPAIVLFFALPTAWGILGSISFFDDAAEWLDGSRSLTPLTSELLSGTQWARAATTLALWMLLPLAIGWWRVRRQEVS